MATRNITFSLPAELVHQAKVYAAEHETTLNSLVKRLLQETVSRENQTRSAVGRLLAIAEGGPYFTMDPGSIRREELHERR